MISVKSYNKPMRKIVFTNNGETEAAEEDSDRAGTGTQEQPWLDKALSNISLELQGWEKEGRD